MDKSILPTVRDIPEWYRLVCRDHGRVVAVLAIPIMVFGASFWTVAYWLFGGD